MKLNIHSFLFCFILGIAIFLRLWQLGNVPVSPDWDEASLGYNAYSLLSTGRDEYGEFMPFVLQSFGDYKPALYTYLVIPTVAIFGLDTFAVRLPSAVMGIVAVIAMYFLVKELLLKELLEVRNKQAIRYLPLATMLFMSISPWHIQFSRVAFEANVGLTFVLLGTLFFLYSLRKNAWYLLLSLICFVLSVYTYQSEKVFVPLLLLVLTLVCLKQILKINRKTVVLSLIVSALLVMPMLQFTLFNKNGLSRAQGASFLSSPTPLVNEKQLRRIEVNTKNRDYIGLVTDNRRVIYAKKIAENYLSHYNPNFLFISGDSNGRHHAPQMGQLYLFEFPLLLLGIYSLVASKINKQTKLLLFSWILLTPLPAAFTWDVPNAVRTIGFVPMFSLLIALGLGTLIQFILKQPVTIKVISNLLLVIVITSNMAYYTNQYFVQYNYFNASDWQYGYKEAIEEINKIEGDYKKIIVSDVSPLDQSYIFFLYYLKFDPASYQLQTRGKQNHNFNKYTFQPVDFDKDKGPQTLFVGGPKDVPKNIRVIKTISNPDGTNAIILWTE